jgi:hypothetical protein
MLPPYGPDTNTPTAGAPAAGAFASMSLRLPMRRSRTTAHGLPGVTAPL